MNAWDHGRVESLLMETERCCDDALEVYAEVGFNLALDHRFKAKVEQGQRALKAISDLLRRERRSKPV